MEPTSNPNSDSNSPAPSCCGASCRLKFTKILTRAKALFVSPAETWKQIESENRSIADIYREYLLILAAVPAVTSFISQAIIGIAPIFGTLIGQVISYGCLLGMVYIAAIVLEFLAPKFDAKISRETAFRLCAYSITPLFVAGVFILFPLLSLLGLAAAALFSIYLFWLGIGLLTNVPEQRRVGFVVVSALATFALGLVVGSLQISMTPTPPPPADMEQISESMKQLIEQALQK